MNLLDLMVRIGVDDKASTRIDGIAGSIKGKLSSAARYGTMALGAVTTAATAGAVAIGKQALDAYADYEQLAGGVEKLFGSASDTVMRNAQRAYMTAGMSANQYMEQATGFSASLIQSLGGDTEEAARLADEAMRAMSDNVNVFGSNMEDVQNAYQGFAKQNYMMLDNLRLGYGGTKEEMQRLIQDAAACTEAQQKLGLSVDANSMSFDNIIKAIQVVQYEQGIWGTTAEEAAKTVSGSIGMTKAAWENFLTELGKPIDEANLTERLTELIDSATLVVENVTPVIQRITAALVAAIPQLVPAALQIGEALIRGIAAGVLNAVPGLHDFMQSDLVRGIVDAWSPVVDKLREIGDVLAPYVQPALEALWQVCQDSLFPALQRLAEACSYFLDELEPWAPHIMNVLVIALEILIITLAAIVDIIAGVINIIGTVMEAMTAFADACEHPKRTLEKLGQAMLGAVGVMSNDLLNALQNLVTALLGFGGDMVMGLVNGIREKGGWIADAFLGFLDEMVSAVKAFLGIASPATVFMNIGQMVVMGLYNGLANTWGTVTRLVSANISSLVSTFGQLPGYVMSVLSTLPGLLLSLATSAMSYMYSGFANGWSTVTSLLWNIPNYIASVFGGLGNILWNAGWNILMGLYNGMVAAWNNMVGWLSSIGGWIQNLKGPLDYDRKLLVENGEAIMAGLQKGLETGYEDVARTVSGMGLGIASSMEVNPSVTHVDDGMAAEIAALRGELRNMRLVLNIDGRAFAEATVNEMDRAFGSMSRRAVAR